ncbi:hypothetical protein E2562_029912 [Oryza meyeriana var. granulata]|uniref:Uncharacterized protein n=1 Tax=Oryza meyeriana var. granulata TaxID=110450 RepID=A0A6G1CUK1_9ORYZ|nr:hypothetical protein E2562_029912 [Oryza meyeriana var. granulata]
MVDGGGEETCWWRWHEWLSDQGVLGSGGMDARGATTAMMETGRSERRAVGSLMPSEKVSSAVTGVDRFIPVLNVLSDDEQL